MLTLLLDADLYAPDHRGVCHVLLANGAVAWIGTDRPDMDPRLEVETIELDGATVVPGLVDGHVHVTGGGGEGGPATSTPPPPLESYSAAGVTSVVGLLGTDDVVRTPGSVLARVRALRSLGLGAWMLTGGYALPPVTVTGDLRTDLVHLEPVLGVGEVAVSDHRGGAPGPDDLVRLATRVRTAALLGGKAGSIHLHLGDGAAGLDPVRRAIADADVPPRHWHPTHVNRSATLLEDAIELACSTGVRIDVTAFPPDPSDPGVGAADAILRALDAGVRLDQLSCSSDAGGSIPTFDGAGRLLGLGVGTSAGLLATVRDLVDGGLPLAEALVPVTGAPARQLGLDRAGSLHLGSGDHLVVLDGDLHVRHTHACGTFHVRDAEVRTQEPFTAGTPSTSTGSVR